MAVDIACSAASAVAFFFQAEDVIRDRDVTGVQTCALPISYSITASATDSSGHPGEARMSLRVRGPNTAPVVTITAPPGDGSAFAGTPVTLAATATDDFDPDPSAAIRWSSSLDGDLGAGATRTVVLPHEGVP